VGSPGLGIPLAADAVGCSSHGSRGAAGPLVARASEPALNPTAPFGVSLGSQALRHVLTERRRYVLSGLLGRRKVRMGKVAGSDPKNALYVSIR
jgi:hypothetical protein